MPEQHRKPDFILYLVVEGRNNEKSRWIRFGAAWKASKGYSLKVEDAFQLFPPFSNPRAGLSLMPFEERTSDTRTSDTRDNDDDRPRNRGRR